MVLGAEFSATVIARGAPDNSPPFARWAPACPFGVAPHSNDQRDVGAHLQPLAAPANVRLPNAFEHGDEPVSSYVVHRTDT